jgi:hypothetical protein
MLRRQPVVLVEPFHPQPVEKTYESTRQLARRLEHGRARILSGTVRREDGRWHLPRSLSR